MKKNIYNTNKYCSNCITDIYVYYGLELYNKKMYKLTVEIDKEVNCIFDINENVKTKLLETVEKKYIEYQSIISTSNIVLQVRN